MNLAKLKNSKTHSLIGTPEYISQAAQEGNHGKKDDLISLGFALAHFIGLEFPWYTPPIQEIDNDKERYIRILKLKKETNIIQWVNI